MKFALLGCLLASPAYAQAPPSNGPSMPSQPSDDPNDSTGPSNGPSAPTAPKTTPKYRKKTTRALRKKPATKKRYRAKPARRSAAPDFDLHIFVGVGVGAYSGTSTASGTATEVTTAGNGISYTLAAGLNFGGITLGAGVMGGTVSEFTVSAGGIEADGKDLILLTFGGYADIGPAEGMHLQLLGGIAQFETADATDPSTGWGGSLGLGYRVRLDEDLGFGLLANLQYLSTSFESTDTTTVFPGAQLTVSWN